MKLYPSSNQQCWAIQNYNRALRHAQFTQSRWHWRKPTCPGFLWMISLQLTSMVGALSQIQPNNVDPTHRQKLSDREGMIGQFLTRFKFSGDTLGNDFCAWRWDVKEHLPGQRVGTSTGQSHLWHLLERDISKLGDSRTMFCYSFWMAIGRWLPQNPCCRTRGWESTDNGDLPPTTVFRRHFCLPSPNY